LATLNNNGIVDSCLDRGKDLWHTKIVNAAAAASWQDQGFRKLYAKVAAGPGNAVTGIHENLPHFLKDETNV
jgi:hypothetical protein